MNTVLIRQDKKFFTFEAEAILAQAIFTRNVDEVSPTAVLVDREDSASGRDWDTQQFDSCCRTTGDGRQAWDHAMEQCIEDATRQKILDESMDPGHVEEWPTVLFAHTSQKRMWERQEVTIPRVADFFKEEHREARVELIDSAIEFARKIQGTAELSYGKSKQEDKIRYEICKTTGPSVVARCYGWTYGCTTVFSEKKWRNVSKISSETEVYKECKVIRQIKGENWDQLRMFFNQLLNFGPQL